MFIGHFAVGLAAKRFAPKTSLGTLFIGAQLIDLLWPIFLLFGIEHVRIDPGNTKVTPLDFYDYPLSHSLMAVIGYALLLGSWVNQKTKRVTAGVAFGVCVASHWILDFITHKPDLPLFPGSTTLLGLGLWNSLWGTLLLEFGLFAAGVWMYVDTVRSRDGKVGVKFWSLILFLVVIHLLNVFGPPPPSVLMIAISANALWLLIAWAYWADKQQKELVEE